MVESSTTGTSHCLVTCRHVLLSEGHKCKILYCAWTERHISRRQ